jgi:frataxin-like iron-binding protein CyaY
MGSFTALSIKKGANMSLNFYKNSENFLLKLCDKIEEFDKDSIFDVDYSDGILDVLVHETGQEYIINRNSANEKIWYSSPISGADYFAFNFDKKQWLNDKNIEIEDKLFKELKTFI